MILVAYAPPLTESDDRPIGLLQAIESVLPQDRMDYTISPEGTPIQVQDREAFLRASALRREISLLCNGIEKRLVSVSGHSIAAVLAPARAPLLDVAIALPETPDYVHQSDELLFRACERLQAFWAVGSPNETAAIIGAQTVFPWIASQPPLGLPALLPPQQLTTALLPHRFGWLNYWSAETARALGFPDGGTNAHWFAGARRSTNGAWLLKLTELPLDLGAPQHLQRLKEAYDRFPKVGRQ
jgi:Family of unknown function (DUF5953)